MTQETLAQYIHRRLHDVVGLHNQISKETGVPQATISRLFISQSNPTLRTIEPILAWFRAYDKSKKSKRKSKSATT